MGASFASPIRAFVTEAVTVDANFGEINAVLRAIR